MGSGEGSGAVFATSWLAVVVTGVEDTSLGLVSVLNVFFVWCVRRGCGESRRNVNILILVFAIMKVLKILPFWSF